MNALLEPTREQLIQQDVLLLQEHVGFQEKHAIHQTKELVVHHLQLAEEYDPACDNLISGGHMTGKHFQTARNMPLPLARGIDRFYSGRFSL